VLKGKRFSDLEGIQLSVKTISTDILAQDFESLLNNGRSAGNIVKIFFFFNSGL
jgi:hypothetical protein